MVRRHNRLLVAFHVVTDAVLGMSAFFLAYLLRFETGLIAITRGHPPVEQYINVLPFIALIVPLGFWVSEQWRPWLFAIVWLLCAIAVSNVLQLYYGPNTVPIAAILSLYALAEGRRREIGKREPDLR